MKTVLLTNFYLEKYTGSELHTLDIARSFEKRGYDVTIAVFQKAHPLLENIGNFRVVECLNEELWRTEYDVIFVQHYPVLDYLCSKYNIIYKKLVISKLSVSDAVEHLPACISLANLVLCVSNECAREVRRYIGEDSRIRVLKNSVCEEFFEAYKKADGQRTLKKIGVVSNHIPDEIRELANVMNEEIEIEYIGMQDTPQLVDISLLKQYDLVITIGRTVQQCFALGVPVYVYDRFGGPGYINDNNFEIADTNNFSGRGGFGQKTVYELKSDILFNYTTNLLQLDKLHNIAKQHYNFEINFEYIYREFLAEGDWTNRNLSYMDIAEIQRIRFYSENAPQNVLNKNLTSQFFFDYGEGFNESDSIRWNVCENYIITKEICVGGIKVIRFDPCDIPSECTIYNLYINGHQLEKFKNIRKKFYEPDPSFVIELSNEEQNSEELKIKIVYRIQKISEHEVYMHSKNQMEKLMCKNNFLSTEEKKLRIENANLYQQITGLKETITAMREYYRLTPKNIIKRLLNKLR